ncbi:MAG: bile acid:sodium symporter family protein, partial [Selenomonadaceae bacterium]|nr:bile acid:sodium symporter family protein [Selenomonadaceae bacterium]
MEKISSFVSKNMLLLVIIFAAVGLLLPASFTWVTPQIPKLLGVIMFGMGMTLRIEDFKEILRRPREIFIGVAAQFLIMPLLAYFFAIIFNLSPDLAAGVILVGTCPGGTASNVMTYLAKGDLALSVSMTMTTTLLAPIVTPILTLWLAGAWIDISLPAMMLSI